MKTLILLNVLAISLLASVAKDAQAMTVVAIADTNSGGSIVLFEEDCALYGKQYVVIDTDDRLVFAGCWVYKNGSIKARDNNGNGYTWNPKAFRKVKK